MARKPFVCGNWKMNTDLNRALGLANDIREGAASYPDVDIAIAPPFTWLLDMDGELGENSVHLAAQNCHYEKKGAFTGEISPDMLMDCGCSFVIVGHSERRSLFGEDDSMVNLKVKAVLDTGLQPILCVGESLDERESGKTLDIVEGQIRKGLEGIKPESMSRLTIAYEPVWAIGTGKTASPAQAQEVHSVIRKIVESVAGRDISGNMRIQYGGSVKGSNAADLFAGPDVDGALVGGASLDSEDFLAIIAAASEKFCKG